MSNCDASTCKRNNLEIQDYILIKNKEKKIDEKIVKKKWLEVCKNF